MTGEDFVKDPAVIRIAAGFGILFSVLGKVSALLKTIPEAVLGGIMLLLFRPIVPGIALYEAVTDHVLLQSSE